MRTFVREPLKRALDILRQLNLTAKVGKLNIPSDDEIFDITYILSDPKSTCQAMHSDFAGKIL